MSPIPWSALINGGLLFSNLKSWSANATERHVFYLLALILPALKKTRCNLTTYARDRKCHYAFDATNRHAIMSICCSKNTINSKKTEYCNFASNHQTAPKFGHKMGGQQLYHNIEKNDFCKNGVCRSVVASSRNIIYGDRQAKPHRNNWSKGEKIRFLPYRAH